MKPAVKAAADTATLDKFLRVELAILFFVVVLALFPYIRDPAVDTKILVYTWGGGLLAAACVAGYGIAKRPLRRPGWFGGLWLILLGWFLVAGLVSRYPGNSAEEVAKFAALMLIFFVASQCYSKPEQVQWLMLTACCAAGLSVIYGIAQHFDYDPFPWNPDLRGALREAPGTFGNGNLAAHTTVLCIAMAVYLAFTKRRRLWCLGFVPLFLIHMHLSNQRGGVVGLAAAAVLIGLAVAAYRRIRRPIPAIAVSFIAMAVIGVIGIAGVMGIMKLRTGVAYPTSLPILLRYHGYSGAARMILKHPILGYGPGNYRYENPAFWTPFEQEHFASKRKMNYRAHNDTLEIGTEAGLPAAGLYLTILIVAIARGLLMAFKDRDPTRRKLGFFFAAFFCIFLVDGLFGFNLRVPVSAMLLFMFAGAFEGVQAAEPGAAAKVFGPRARWAVILAVPIVAVATMAFDTDLFAAQMQLQRAAGAQYYKAYPQAEQFLSQGERLDWWNWEFPYQRGETALRQYHPQEAVANYERALGLNPNFPPVLVSLAHAYVMLAEVGAADQPVAERLKILDRSTEYARRALMLCPQLAEGEDMLGRAGCLRASLLQQEADAGRGGPKIRDQVAEAWRDAEQHLVLAIKNRVREPDRVYVMLARVRMSLSDKVGAQDALIRAANANPSNANVWPLFAQFAEQTGQERIFRDTVLACIKKLRDDGQEPPAGLQAVAQAWDAQSGGILAATGLLAKAAVQPASRTPGPPKESLVWAADVLLKRLSLSGLTDKDVGTPGYNLAMVFASAGQWDKAAKVMAVCWPKLPPAVQADGAILWAQALTQLKQDDKALDVLRDAVNRVGGNIRLQVTYARVLARSGRAAEARNEYEILLRASQLDPKDRAALEQELAALPASKP